MRAFDTMLYSRIFYEYAEYLTKITLCQIDAMLYSRIFYEYAKYPLAEISAKAFWQK
jgi:hypothetical protein